MRHFDVLGWEDDGGNRHLPDENGTPDVPQDLDDTFGIFVHVYDTDDDEYHHYFWAFSGSPYEDWDDWWDLIEEMMDMYGMETA